jgi:DNA-3-methyladenine glycosylase
LRELREVLAGPVLEVAPRLLGATLRHGDVALRVTEVEAYDGPNDPGSHAYRGRTERNAVMFGPPAHLYVYFTYGMHHCCNVVVGPVGTPSAVLLRAGEVVEGQDIARARRPRSRERDLARGPARLCEALGITREQDGADLTSGQLTLVLGDPVVRVETGPRVGLRGAPDRPWRYWIPGEPSVSTYRPATPLRGRPGPDLGAPGNRC